MKSNEMDYNLLELAPETQILRIYLRKLFRCNHIILKIPLKLILEFHGTNDDIQLGNHHAFVSITITQHSNQNAP